MSAKENNIKSGNEHAMCQACNRAARIPVNAPVLSRLRRSKVLMRGIAATVALAFAMLILAPTAVAARALYEKPALQAPVSGPETRLADALAAMEERLDRLEAPLANGLSATTQAAGLATQRRQLEALDPQISAGFALIGEWIEKQGLAETIGRRHREAVAQYRRRMAQLFEALDGIAAATDASVHQSRVEHLKSWLASRNPRRTPPSFDPDDLPNTAHKADRGNQPRLTPDAFARTGLHHTPSSRLAAPSAFTPDTLPGANDPAYLAETPEVVLTRSIRDQAAALGHDPVRIYHWVRNQIEWLPTWGAWQDAALTLAAKRGNAMDIAGLTIALLRAAGIPARYAHGTIELPAERFTNWVGDFADVEAARELANVGGIPTTAVTAGGKTTKMRLEHVWVEAAIDFVPSRGARNHTADTWVDLDPSYKQYAYLQGLDVITIAGIDPEQLARSFVDSGSVNETASWVTGFDAAILEDAQDQAQQALEAYIRNHLTDPTVGEVIGGRKAIVQEYPVLPSALPYQTLATAATYAGLPDPLRHRMRLALSTDAFGAPVDAVTYPWARLNNQRLTLSFKPATSEDEATLSALLPDAEITAIDQLPRSIPAYLIEVIPELKLDGRVISSGSPMNLGEELAFTFQTLHPLETQSPYTYPVIAGSYLAIAVFGQNVSPELLETTRQRLTRTKTTLEGQDPTLIGSLTREDLLGDLFHAGTLGYFAQYTALSHIAALSQRASHSLSMGYGSYGYEPNVDSFFGIPRAIEPGGVAMNVRVGRYLGTHANDPEQKKQLNIQTGMLSSALEHAVPEQMFVTEQNPGEAISAVRALAKANALGQRIYHITRENQGSVLGNIRHDAQTMAEIRSALAVGKEVITHTDAVSVPGWSGAGYIILDPDTGDGAYKISGGKDGGYSEIDQSQDLFSISAFYLNTYSYGAALFDLKSLVAWLGKVVKIFSFATFILNVLELLEECVIENNTDSNLNHEAMAVIAISAITIITTLTVLLSGLSYANPLFGLIVGTFLDVVGNKMIDVVRQESCR